MEADLCPVVLLSVTRGQKGFVPAVERDVEPCGSLTWACRGLPYALIGMQGKTLPRGFFSMGTTWSLLTL